MYFYSFEPCKMTLGPTVMLFEGLSFEFQLSTSYVHPSVNWSFPPFIFFFFLNSCVISNYFPLGSHSWALGNISYIGFGFFLPLLVKYMGQKEKYRRDSCNKTWRKWAWSTGSQWWVRAQPKDSDSQVQASLHEMPFLVSPSSAHPAWV